LKKKKFITVLILFSVIFLLIYNYSLVYYGLIQARGQLKIVFNTVPVKEILGDASFPDSLKNKVRLIQEVRSYAIYNLGLKGEKNYTTYYDQQGKELMWVVTACEPYQLESYTWNFPILGSFTYKGFFIREMAEKEAARLNSLGFDTSIRNAGGWSTLGILKDPILSGMLDRSNGALVELIIHELTHGTIFIRNDVSFNENLATFIGTEGTKIFLSDNYGERSNVLGNYVRMVEDREKFSDYVLLGAELLDSLYLSFGPEWSVSQKEEEKSIWFQEFIENLDTLKFNNCRYYENYFTTSEINNTFFMSYLRYRGGLGQFEKTFTEKFDHDLVSYIRFLKEEYK